MYILYHSILYIIHKLLDIYIYTALIEVFFASIFSDHFLNNPRKKVPETNLHPASPLSNHHYRQAPGLSIFTLSHVVFIPGTDPGIIIPIGQRCTGVLIIKPTHRTSNLHSRELTWPLNRWHPKRKRSSSKHKCSGTMSVSGRVITPILP